MYRAMMAAAAVCGMLAAGSARADAIYSFVTTSSANSGNHPPPNGLAVSISLDLTDTQVRFGSFDLYSPENDYGGVPTYFGDLGGFNSITVQTEPPGTPALGVTETATPSYLHGSLDIHLTFDQAGNIDVSDLTFYGASSDVILDGTGGLASGWAGSVAGCAGVRGGPCTFSGYWTGALASVAPIPEPASLALLGAGVIGLGLARRRRASSLA